MEFGADIRPEEESSEGDYNYDDLGENRGFDLEFVEDDDDQQQEPQPQPPPVHRNFTAKTTKSQQNGNGMNMSINGNGRGRMSSSSTTMANSLKSLKSRGISTSMSPSPYQNGRSLLQQQLFEGNGTNLNVLEFADDENFSDEDQDQEEDYQEYQDYPGEYQENGMDDYEGGGGGQDDDEYPDTLQFCEAQFDDELEDDDEEARGLPPVARGYYGDNDGNVAEQGSKTRITTNASGIRIVESSTILENDDDAEDYEQYQYDQQVMPLQVQPKVRMNKPRKKVAKVPAETLLRQLQTDAFDFSKPNILARKLMGVPSQTVQSNSHRPPPLQQKPKQNQSNQKLVSLESILRQNRSTSSNLPPRLLPKSSNRGDMLVGSGHQNPLKIKSSHGIPSSQHSKPYSLQQRQKVQNSQNFQQNPRFQKDNSNSTVIKRGRPSLQHRQQHSPPSQSQQNNYPIVRNSLRNGVTISNANSASGNSSLYISSGSRLSIASIQKQLQEQQQQTLLQQQQLQQQLILQQQMQQQQQPQTKKNVPRCPVCKRTFATNQVLQRHMVLHATTGSSDAANSGDNNSVNGGDGYKCEECFEELESPFQLAKHMQLHHNNSNGNGNDNASSNTNANGGGASDASGGGGSGLHRCRVCYRTFTCLESLKAHSLMHDGEFKCRACRRGFPDWNSLEEHEATHKRYNCQWCEKYFMNSGNLKAHERIHTGERPYKCADCPKAFKQLGGLQYHLKTNPSHKPQKYHKNLEGGEDGLDEMQEGDEMNGGFHYGNNYDSEDYEDAINNGGGMTLEDIAASAGL